MKLKLTSFIILCLNIALSLGLVGCAPGLNADRYLTNLKEYMGNEGKPQAYIDGYVDGCSTGRRMAGDKKFCYRRNHIRADRDALYARGWQDGQICCRNEYIAEKQKEEQERNESKGFFGFSLEEQRQQKMEKETKGNETELREIWDLLKK